MSTHVVTGAASGMGRVLVERLVERGDRVLAVVRSQRRLEQLYDEVPGLDAVQVADLADIPELSVIAHELAASYDRVDSLLHVAGEVDLFGVADLDLVQWERQLAVNLTAPAVLTRAFLPALRAARGTVVFVNSSAGLSASPRWSAYAASKFGLRALADSLRAEEREHGIRVTTVYPSRTATPMQEKVHVQEGKEYDATRWATPSTVADTVLQALDLPEDATITELTVRPR